MKKLQKEVVVFFAAAGIFITSCRPEEKPCTEPVEVDRVEATHHWMLRHQLGDTIYFKKYQVNKDSGRRYVYLENVSFILQTVDTPEVIYYEEIPDFKCDKKIFSYPIRQTFIGSGGLSCRLDPQGSFAWLRILFQKKDFRIDNDQYNHLLNVKEKIVIGGKEYLKVNAFPGYDDNAWGESGAYKDSTVAFYNSDYGILKFIINDALVYERYLK